MHGNIKLVVNRKCLELKYCWRILNCLVNGYVGTFSQTLTTVQITCLGKTIELFRKTYCLQGSFFTFLKTCTV